MKEKKFQNTVASGRFTLPVAILYYIGVCLWTLREVPLVPDAWVTFANVALLLLVAYGVQEMHNRFMLVRVRTYMVPSVFLLLAGSSLLLTSSWQASAVALSGVLHLYLLYCTYQLRIPSGYIFYAFMLMSAASVQIPQLLYLVPFVFLNMVIQLRSLDIRSFFAGIMGLFLPYAVWLFYAYYTDTWDMYYHFRQLAEIPIPTLEGLEGALQNPDVWIYLPLCFFCLFGAWHMAMKSYDDKIKPRMLLKVLLTQHVLVFLLILWQPHLLSQLLVLQMATGSVILTHYFALTSHWFTNTLFFLFLIYYIAFTIYTIWMPSLNFL